MRVGYSCVAIMASVGVMVVEIGWQGKKQEELWEVKERLLIVVILESYFQLISVMHLLSHS